MQRMLHRAVNERKSLKYSSVMSYESEMMSADHIDVVVCHTQKKKTNTPEYSKGTKVRARHHSPDGI